ncbi:MAG: 30S ribosomal protein S20 [Patescibacteria group bacterium]|nr:30S ribosomal protein S20 [Patescibacteria group bacterium]
MPIKKSAAKELRKSKVRTAKNAALTGELDTIKKHLLKAIASDKKDDAKKLLLQLQTRSAKAAKSHAIPANTSRRNVSRLTKAYNRKFAAK